MFDKINISGSLWKQEISAVFCREFLVVTEKGEEGNNNVAFQKLRML